LTDLPGNSVPSPTLQELVRTRTDEHGWSYSDLERRSGRSLSRGRWQQLGSGVPQRKFPDPTSLEIIAAVLDVDVTTVVLAAARTVGLDTRQQGSGLAHLLPPGTDRLSTRTRDALLTVIRAAVADAIAVPGVPDVSLSGKSEDRTVEWPKSAAQSNRRHNGSVEDGAADGR
jgi:hypothetical protein